ncbi:VCBS repeat-containing protein [Streptomyces sp. AC536]|uniref:FG-GAP repeat domain-containing protein n=1 Tax=Streptomyces buecherae TaxID=2763006 RepID=UPI00164DC3B3|nr:VCBS repeat-containing protein [Streptomyces buecherae]MBC3985531.1 VCBS repeat-containing protein [Streptomyces buecherae]QNJ41897.1 VCBS repeat-containing protein [Streptomyces buecherae]
MQGRIRVRAARWAVASAAALAVLLTTNPALAEPASGGDGTAVTSRAADLASLAAAAPITRDEVIVRARSWLRPSVPYSQNAKHTNEYGTYRTDCSGYVSMTWGLPAPGPNTVGLLDFSSAITKADLKTGDVLLDAQGDSNTRHVVLFDKWVNDAQSEYWGYEQAGGTGTVYRKIPYPYSSTPAQFKPYRYRNIIDGHGRGTSLSGDGRSELASVLDNGDVKAWHNGGGFAEMPWDGDVVIGRGFTKDNIHFADLDGDGRSELVSVQDNGDVKAWHNGRGFTEMPWDGDVVIGRGFTKDNIHFADLDGDGRSELVSVQDNGDVKAWHNGRGFTEMPWDGDVVIGRGFARGNVHFADLDGDGRSELASVLDNGDVKAWHNGRGFAEMPWDGDVVIGRGFARGNVHFADLDGDGRSELASVLDNGDVKAWHNGRGFAEMPWDGDVVIGRGFTKDNIHFA